MDKLFIRDLKARAHHINPVVLLGAKGLTDAVVNEIDLALTAHELIKVKMKGQEREDRIALANEMAERTGAFVVQMIGNMAVLYRKKED